MVKITLQNFMNFKVLLYNLNMLEYITIVLSYVGPEEDIVL